MTRVLFIGLCAGILFTGMAAGQESLDTVSLDVSTADTAPVTVPEPDARAMRYYHTGILVWFTVTAWTLILPAIILFTGFSARLRDLARKWGRYWFFTLWIYLLLFALVTYVLNLPLSFYTEYVRPHAYDLSNLTLAKWAFDGLKVLGLTIALGIIPVTLLYGFLRIAPKRWWLYTGLAALPLLILGSLIAPVWIEPLFNDFGPMQDQELEGQILDLAHRAGMDGGRVFEVDKSTQTKTVNAYVSGFRDTKQIVLWDTLLEKLDDEEVLFVMGHELGHYVMGHVTIRILFAWAVILAVLYLIKVTAGGLLYRFHERFGFHRLDDVASLPLILLVANVYMLIASPLLMGFTRYQEREADRFGAELTQLNRAGAMAFVRLQDSNLANPHPYWWDKMLRASHPPIGERIDFLNEYRPWETGDPLRHGHYFRESAPDVQAGDTQAP